LASVVDAKIWHRHAQGCPCRSDWLPEINDASGLPENGQVGLKIVTGDTGNDLISVVDGPRMAEIDVPDEIKLQLSDMPIVPEGGPALTRTDDYTVIVDPEGVVTCICPFAFV
jgi:hypothetical protein